MELLLTRHLWGITVPWEQSFPRIHAAGYRAIEAPLPNPAEQNRFLDLLAQYDFAYIAMIFTSGATVAEHIDYFQSQATTALSFRPLLINSHSGRDAWDPDQSSAFFEQALAFEATLDVPVAHETHRGRILFNPWTTDRLIQQYDRLQLCWDLSHWVCVCERLLDDQLEVIRRCAERCLHLHTRVGFEHGPQVPDPRAPEYQRHLEAHERWWDMAWDAQAAQGRTQSTLTPEFGPPGYLHTLPFTNMPVADLWEVCNWMAQRQANRFAQR